MMILKRRLIRQCINNLKNNLKINIKLFYDKSTDHHYPIIMLIAWEIMFKRKDIIAVWKRIKVKNGYWRWQQVKIDNMVYLLISYWLMGLIHKAISHYLNITIDLIVINSSIWIERDYFYDFTCILFSHIK